MQSQVTFRFHDTSFGKSRLVAAWTPTNVGKHGDGTQIEGKLNSPIEMVGSSQPNFISIDTQEV